MIAGCQMRAARALLRWSASDLAASCGVSMQAIQRAEQTDEVPNMLSRNMAAIRSALERAGVVFLDADGNGPGVRLRKGP